MLQCPQIASIGDLLYGGHVSARRRGHRVRRADGNDAISHESKISKMTMGSDGDNRRDVRDLYGKSINLAYLEYFP